MKKMISKFAFVAAMLSSVSAFASSNSNQTKMVDVNFVFGTAFTAYVCTNSPKTCSDRLGVFSSYSFPAEKGKQFCVVTNGLSRHYEYYFTLNDNESGEINFWGAYVYPNYNMSHNITGGFEKTIWDGPRIPTCSNFEYLE